MVKNKAVCALLFVFVGISFLARANADDILSQPDFTSSRSESWGSFTAAIGIASGTVSEFVTTTAALGSFMRAYLGWECDLDLENYGAPYWCNHYIPLSVATTTLLGTSTHATVFQNPSQAVDGNVELFYVDFYGGDPAYMGFGVDANTTPDFSWAWTCGPYCRQGGEIGGTSNDFVPYLQMGPQADPPSIDSLGQFVPNGTSLPRGGVATEGSIVFRAIPHAATQDPLVIQVEVEPIGTRFASVPTASSTEVVSGGVAVVTVTDLAEGDYVWKARSVDDVTHESSPWIPFGEDDGAADFAVQVPKEPVVLIPGIVGSRLVRAVNGKEVWPDVNDMLLSPDDGYLDDLALAPNGSEIAGKEMMANSIIDQESVLGISASYYRPLLQALTNDGYGSGTKLFAFPYDWRLGIPSAAAALTNTIAAARAASPDGKISIVAHSMGGLVLKEYLAGLPDASFIDKVVLLGDPQLGAPLAFKDLNYGDNLGFQIPLLNLDILNHGEVKKIVQNMPSLYDLLPSRAYIADNGGYVQDFRNGGDAVLDYDATTRAMLADPADSRNGDLIASAGTLHDTIDGAAMKAPDVYNIVGCSEPTITGYRIYDSGVVDVTRTDGDGIVPVVSAMDRADGFKNYFISGSKTGITHTDLVSDERVARLVTAILDGGASSFALPDGFSTTTSSCFDGNGFVEFSAHHAGGLTLQNSDGSFTGVNASGTVDVGISGSTYDVIGDNYFITVPAGSDYRVIAQSSSSDDLIVTATGYKGNDATQTATYVVSSTAPSGGGSMNTTTATLYFSGSGVPAGAKITQSENVNSSTSDDAGSSTIGFSVAPIVGSSSNDVVPPQITVSGISDPISLGSTTTIFFSASDTESGVALLHATLNGSLIVSGDTVTFTQEGRNILLIEAIDGAGNPSVKEIDFTVSPPLAPHTASFVPIADTYVDGNDPGENYGDAHILRIRSRGKDRSLIKFDDAAIRAAVGSSTIISATLTLSVAKNWENETGTDTMELYRMISPWTEGGATWNTEDDTSSPPWAATPSAMAIASNDSTITLSFDVASDVRSFADGAENDGWILKKADECMPGVIDFGSRESDLPPELMISYGP